MEFKESSAIFTKGNLKVGIILTTECALIDIKEEAAGHPPMGGGMPGMM